MAAGFFLVASVTFGVLALIVAVVTALMLAGVAEVSADYWRDKGLYIIIGAPPSSE